MTEAIISTGSNSYAKYHLQYAQLLLKKHFHLLNESSVLVTKPHGKQYKKKFHNQAIKLQTKLNKEETIQIFKEIEKEMGRTFYSKIEGKIPIDIDLIIWNNEIVHPDYQRFGFVKQCVDEIK